jgi:hypothetical protein
LSRLRAVIAAGLLDIGADGFVLDRARVWNIEDVRGVVRGSGPLFEKPLRSGVVPLDLLLALVAPIEPVLTDECRGEPEHADSERAQDDIPEHSSDEVDAAQEGAHELDLRKRMRIQMSQRPPVRMVNRKSTRMWALL